jgi:hypothetical protein
MGSPEKKTDWVYVKDSIFKKEFTKEQMDADVVIVEITERDMMEALKEAKRHGKPREDY